MPNGKRKIPFSGKRKKEQLIMKRSNKSSLLMRTKSTDDSNESDSDEGDDKILKNVRSLNKQPTSSTKNHNVNKYNLQFREESKNQLKEMKKNANKPFTKLDDNKIEIDEYYFIDYDFPIRPKWHHDMTKEELSRNENRYFKEFVDAVIKKQSTEENIHKFTSVFELNLDTWRQLWRVIEMSDILLIIVDARFPTLMFPPSLFYYLENQLRKNVILILNKIDLIPSELALAWKEYFIGKYQGIRVVSFASYTRILPQNHKYYTKQKRHICYDSIKEIKEYCKDIVSSHNIDLTSWDEKILEDSQRMSDDCKTEIVDQIEKSTKTSIDCVNSEMEIKFKNGILTIGCIGFPNSGKSSLINALKGSKCVSVSKTPGHTKHFQTIFLTENVKLCDSPGLVFPSKTPKHLQVLIGSYPIAQLKEPYQSLVYVGERIDLATTLNLKLPSDFDQWSALAICEAWCLKRGFLTAKASRPDHYRAANNLLRMLLEGKIMFEIYPPEFKTNKEKLLLKHSELEKIKKVQGCEKRSSDKSESSSDNSESGDDITRNDTESDGNEDDDEDDYNVDDGGTGQFLSESEERKNLFDLLDSD